jgi:hypothetical protein
LTSREIIKAVLTFDHPPRIGMTLPAPYPNDFLSGRRSPAVPYDTPLPPQGSEAKRWRDPWGSIWATLDPKVGGEVMEAGIKDWAELDSYQPPNLGNPADYAKAAAEFAADKTHFRVGGIPGFTFNVARYIRKLENYLCDLIVERPNVDRLNAMVRKELLKTIDCWAAAGADAIMFCEDWGTQDRLMISPDLWREVFKPEFRALAGRAREHGLFVLMHSCGKMTAVIEDIIECGVHCLQFDSPHIHGIEHLADTYGGRITFWCPVDIQRTLQTRDPRKIRAEAKLMIERLGAFGGGFIAGHYGSEYAIGLTPDVQENASKAFVEFGSYK